MEPSHLKMDGFEEDVVMHAYKQMSSKVAAVVQCGKEKGEFDEDFWMHSHVTNYSLYSRILVEEKEVFLYFVCSCDFFDFS